LTPPPDGVDCELDDEPDGAVPAPSGDPLLVGCALELAVPAPEAPAVDDVP